VTRPGAIVLNVLAAAFGYPITARAGRCPVRGPAGLSRQSVGFVVRR